jgi:hypothetical protein
MAIIKKYRHRLSGPSRGKDEVDRVVSIDIPRLDQKAARRRDKVNCLPPGCRKLELDPVVSRGGPDLVGLDTGEIGALVTVEIGNGKRPARSHRRNRCTLNICSRSCHDA